MKIFGKEIKLNIIIKEKVIKKEIVIEEKYQPFSEEQEKRIVTFIENAFEKNKYRTRLTCWHCGSGIDEKEGYCTWLGVRLHNQCSSDFREKVAPVLQGMKNAQSGHLWEGMPVFTVNPITVETIRKN